MGANGTGDVNLGSSGSDGFNMAAMMASMTIGSAVGQIIAGTMNNMMSGISQSTQPQMPPPPIPVVEHHVAVNGQAVGLFDINSLTQMADTGQITFDVLVWKNGMTQLGKAEMVDELKTLFTTAIPPIPPQN